MFLTDSVKSPNINFQVSNFSLSRDVSCNTRRDMAKLNVDLSDHCEVSDHANSLYIICRFILMSKMCGHLEPHQFIHFLINYFLKHI